MSAVTDRQLNSDAAWNPERRIISREPGEQTSRHDLQRSAPAPRVRCFVDVEFSRYLPRIERVDYVHNLEDDFDVIVAGTPAARTFAQLWSRCSNPAAPMIAFTDALRPRADVVLYNTNAADLATALTSVQDIARRVSCLPAIPVGLDRNGLLALALSYTRDCPIEARWQPNSPTVLEYPLLFGIDNARSVLEEMAEAGLLRRRFAERVHVCPSCQSSRLQAREVCVRCKSTFLSEEPLVHHYACAWQGTQSKFETGGGLVCPKCHKQLRHYGVDYDKPGVAITCMACGDTVAEPEVGFTCVDCNTYASAEHTNSLDWCHYDLLPDGVAILHAGQLPHAEVVERSTGGCSLRDFRLVVGRALPVARRHNRPLTAWRARIDIEDLRRQVGPRGAHQISQFVHELVLQRLREGDLVATLSDGVVVCLPETDRATAEQLAEQVTRHIKKTVRPQPTISIALTERDRIPALLEELR